MTRKTTFSRAPRRSPYPFSPGIDALTAMDAVKGPDGVWTVAALEDLRGGIERASLAEWKSRHA